MISIVIPLYNKAQSIEGTIRCIQVQTYQDFEIVVVEGWSTDGSLEKIKALAEEDSRIRVIMQQNCHGITPARNEGVLAAKNEHIAFIDGDDYWAPTYLESLLKLIHDYPNAGIWGLCHGIQTESEGNIMRKPEISSRLKGFRGILENPWLNFGCPYWTGATAISRKAFDAVGGFDNRIIFGEDIDLWYRIMLRFPAAFDASETLAYYRTDAENRACDHVFPLSLHIPYYIDKYAADRTGNADFRKFFDLQCLYRLFPYTCKKEYRKDLHRILKQIDFSLQKPSMRLRFIFPRLYKVHQRRKGRISTISEEYQGGSLYKKI